MKKIAFLVTALLASAGSFAAATTICTGGVAQTASQVPIGTFVIVAFTPKCSNNVILHGNDLTTYYTVAAASTKGKNAFYGSSAGGGIVPNTAATCAATGCLAADVTAAQTLADAISS